MSLAQVGTTDPGTHAAAPAVTATTDPALGNQVAVLRSKVAKLEAALQQRGQATGNAMPGMGSPQAAMPMDKTAAPIAMGGKAAMGGMMPMDMGMMGSEMGAGAAPMPSGGKMAAMDDATMMGMAPDSASMAMPSALPGFPGASHLYHIGSTGFFLDHSDHILLSIPQQASLNATKEKALLEKAAIQRDVDAAENSLWTLTASDQPDSEKIEAKLREVEKRRGDQRLAFIRAVGEAATFLTDVQRQSLLGLRPPQTNSPASAAPASIPTAPMPVPPAGGMPAGGGMGDM
jgi:hypothetical protein